MKNIESSLSSPTKIGILQVTKRMGRVFVLLEENSEMELELQEELLEGSFVLLILTLIQQM
jgi:hypothetical protein